MLFSCDNIHMHFGARPVLQGISLGVHPSEVLGIVGPNGAGKTTLLEILSGRTKPTQGRVLFEGQDVTAMPLHQRARRGLARTYQSPVQGEMAHEAGTSASSDSRVGSLERSPLANRSGKIW